MASPHPAGDRWYMWQASGHKPGNRYIPLLGVTLELGASQLGATGRRNAKDAALFSPRATTRAAGPREEGSQRSQAETGTKLRKEKDCQFLRCWISKQKKVQCCVKFRNMVWRPPGLRALRMGLVPIHWLPWPSLKAFPGQVLGHRVVSWDRPVSAGKA